MRIFIQILNAIVMITCNSLVLYEAEKSPLSRFNKPEQTVEIGNNKVTLVQNWSENGVAGVLWDSAIILSKFALEHNLFTNKRIIELGAGLGLPSIVACKNNASHVIATDQSDALSLLNENIKLNLTPDEQEKVTVKEIDWQEEHPDITADIIFGADLVYKKDVFEALKNALINLSNGSTIIYMASKIRYEKDSQFYESLKTHFKVEKVFFDKDTDVVVFKIQKL